MISRQESEQLIGNEDGNFLVRESNNPPGSVTLAIRFNSETKNYKVYFDGAFYVGEKRFDTIADLVHDGLISFYIEKHASNYIAMMAEENNYAESPYVVSRTALLARQNRQSLPAQKTSPPQSQTNQSMQTSYQRQHNPSQNIHQQFQQQIHQQLQHTLSGNFHHQLLQQATNTMTQLDKENRLFSDPESRNQVNSSSKSNNIIDRFNIMNSEKPHRFKSQNFKGPHWCDFCLNFMWGLVSQGVKCQDCGFQAHKKCSERTPADCEPQMRYIKRIFGVDLTTLVKATNSIRPVVIEKCIEEIERRKGAIESEGLYRVSGFSDAIDELRLSFDRNDNVDFNEFKYNDIHVICSLLKLYLRQLPIPLVTFEVYNKLIDSLSRFILFLKKFNFKKTNILTFSNFFIYYVL